MLFYSRNIVFKKYSTLIQLPILARNKRKKTEKGLRRLQNRDPQFLKILTRSQRQQRTKDTLSLIYAGISMRATKWINQGPRMRHSTLSTTLKSTEIFVYTRHAGIRSARSPMKAYQARRWMLRLLLGCHRAIYERTKPTKLRAYGIEIVMSKFES
jgi:hypothetical protein